MMQIQPLVRDGLQLLRREEWWGPCWTSEKNLNSSQIFTDKNKKIRPNLSKSVASVFYCLGAWDWGLEKL